MQCTRTVVAKMHADDMPEDWAAEISVAEAAAAFTAAAAACLAARSSANDSANVADCQGSCIARRGHDERSSSLMLLLL